MKTMKDYLRRADHKEQVKLARAYLDTGELEKLYLEKKKSISESNVEEVPDPLAQEALDEFTYTK